MSGAGHSLIEVLVIFLAAEKVRRQCSVGILLHASRVDMLANLVFRLQPNATQRFSLPQINVSGMSECEQTVGATTRSPLHRLGRLFLNKLFDAPRFAIFAAPSCGGGQIATQRP